MTDLPARGASQATDRRSVIDNITAGAESLYALVSAWPLTHVREAHINGAERSLAALGALLVDLRAHVAVREQSEILRR